MKLFMELRQELLQLAEDNYKNFSAGLLPGVERMLGVRLPQLRKLAKRVADDDWQAYLAEEPYYFEERMLQGMVIGAIKVSPEERLRYIADFVPKIDSWSVCDSFCSGLKFTKKNQALVWELIQSCLQSDSEYQIRFAVVMMMDYYLTEAYIEQVLMRLDDVHHDGYCVKMAVAWALATALAKQPEPTWKYFQQHHLDSDTWKKTIQKCIESNRISQERKTALRKMRASL